MRNAFKGLVIGSLLLFGATACADLDVANYNAPDAARSLASAGDVESLIVGAYNTFFSGEVSYFGPGMYMSNAAFSHNAPWSNSGMEQYGRLPRIAIINDVSDSNYNRTTRVWYYSYRALAAVSDGLRSLDDPDIADELGSESVASLRAFGKFVQGMGHAGVAMLYDRGFIVDETIDLTEAQEPVDYGAIMAAAMGYFDEAIALSGAADIEYEWVRADITGADFGRLIHSYKARFGAQVARTPTERAALNWNAIKADVDAGIQETFLMHYDWDLGWENAVMGYQTWYSWSQLSYWMYGMADQSGNYQEWLALPMGEKSYQFADGRNVLIVTPDDRFPQGSTVQEQLDNGEGYFMITPPAWQGNTWKKPERGVWRWSWYKDGIGHRFGYWWDDVFEQPEINITEMDMLKAEALYRSGDMAGAATLINKTRILHGLNATDAAGANTSCVPKLPNGQCGDLWEILKWEKRMEAVFTGFTQNNWWFDGRGWGDLWKDTPLQLAIPCQEIQVLQMLPCTTFGGPGGEGGAAVSSYNFPFEG